jgi:hypothetical protein
MGNARRVSWERLLSSLALLSSVGLIYYHHPHLDTSVATEPQATEDVAQTKAARAAATAWHRWVTHPARRSPEPGGSSR